MILLLAGTAEARALAARLAEAGVPAVASFAGAVASIEDLPLPVRIGGFGGDDGFRRYLASEPIRAVIDATHPFAARITARTVRICTERGLPCLRLERPAWREGPDDTWHHAATLEEAARMVPRGARVLLAVGRLELGRLIDAGGGRFPALEGCEVLLRSIDPPRTLPEGWRNVVARPPASAEDETAFMALAGIDWLVCRNAGGAASFAKVAAARRLGLRVAMIDRPPPPDGMPIVSDAEAALAWARTIA